nr:unnamed protein product [Spirometra erinaceieuropaei]
MYVGIVNREYGRFQRGSVTEDQFKCLIFICGLQCSKDADIRTCLLSKMLQNNSITLQKLAAECQTLLNLMLDSAIIQNPATSCTVRTEPSTKSHPVSRPKQVSKARSPSSPGARLLPNGQSKDDIVSRIDAARWVFSSLRKCQLIRRDLSIATKIRVYRASVRYVLLYGCECWALRVEDGRKLEVFDHYCLRILLRVKLTDFVSNEIVRARYDNIARITQAIQERRLRWFGHVLRRPPQELSVTALDPAPLCHWRRRRGGQFKTWLETVRQDMEVVLGPSVFGLRRWRREWVELSRSAAADRHAWRGTVRDIIEAG